MRSSRTLALRRAGQEGITLVAVLVMVAISAILLGKAAESWESVMEHEREAELIFRGEEYAEAIEFFYAAQGRLPTKLEELLELEPRSIRRLYEDPYAKDGQWVIIHSGPQGERVPRIREGEAPEGETDAETDSSGPTRSQVRYRLPGQASRQQLQGGFIVGVSSSSQRTAFISYQNSTSVAEWEFVASITPARVNSRDPARAAPGRGRSLPSNRPQRSGTGR